MSFELFTIYAVDIDDVTIAQIISQGISTEAEEMLAAGDGQIHPSFVTADTIAPVIAFSTSGLTAPLTKYAPLGFPLASGAIGTFFFRQREEGAGLASGSVNIKAVVNEGIIVPQTLSADQTTAVLTSLVAATFDGTNLPIVVTTNAALIGTPAITELHVAGPIMINGVQLEGIVSVEIDFGMGLNLPPHDGTVYPKKVTVNSIRPTITIRTLDAVALSTFGIEGTALGATPSVVYLRGKEEGEAVYANTAEKHISITTTASKGRITVRGLSSEQGDDATCEIVITPTSAGVLHPLTIATNVVIPGAI